MKCRNSNDLISSRSDSTRAAHITQCSTERAELAELEELLLSALVAPGSQDAKPEGVAESQIDAAAGSLFRKRFRAIRNHNQMTIPEMEYFQLMKEYAQIYPGSHPGGICSDAARFHQFIEAKRGTPGMGMNIFARLKCDILRLFSIRTAP